MEYYNHGFFRKMTAVFSKKASESSSTLGCLGGVFLQPLIRWEGNTDNHARFRAVSHRSARGGRELFLSDQPAPDRHRKGQIPNRSVLPGDSDRCDQSAEPVIAGKLPGILRIRAVVPVTERGDQCRSDTSTDSLRGSVRTGRRKTRSICVPASAASAQPGASRSFSTGLSDSVL